MDDTGKCGGSKILAAQHKVDGETQNNRQY